MKHYNYKNKVAIKRVTSRALTCSLPTLETSEQCVKYVQSEQ